MANSQDVLLTAFQSAVEKQSSSPTSSTPRTYRWGASVFLSYLDTTPLAQFDAQLWQGFPRWLALPQSDTGKPLTGPSVRTAITASKAFVRWAASQGMCRDLTPGDWSAITLPEPVAAEPVRAMTSAEVSIFMAAVAEEPEPHRTIFALLPLMQVKIGDLCAAPLAGVRRSDEGGVIVHCWHRNCGMPPSRAGTLSVQDIQSQLRAVVLSPRARAALGAYLTHWRRGLDVQSPWLFPAANDPRLHIPTDTVRKQLQRLRERTRLPWLTLDMLGKLTI